ncbi:uncharacterized protein PV09_00908 [Verruconis gallopava]|uniref:Ribose-phosphate pyrophosphokinase N-terminal domain-containing protein n=1 Tax=Verruconis gallopava TaxID=253628 RepID=A0A0D1Y1V9_9PEZI|nr:uncharacterized protein PV09_00908 [Verruconis gallopava]KIW09011.1 hypothetical protein PV09_00908 [Verruconis gallopava]
MVRNIIVIGGNSHPQLTEQICNHLGIPPAKALLSKFSVGETRVEIGESVRGKDVFIIQSGGGKINDHLMELLITISACKTASANRVTAVLPLFPYSRQSDIPYNKTGAPLSKNGHARNQGSYTFESRPQTPYISPSDARPNSEVLHKRMSELQMSNGVSSNGGKNARFADGQVNGDHTESPKKNTSDYFEQEQAAGRSSVNGIKPADNQIVADRSKPPVFEPQRGYRQWVAQAGTLIADLLTCAGADHVITMDLHDPQYQGFFDIPVDNLYGRQLLKHYIKYNIPNYQQAVIVSPDAGGAKRATAIADALGMPFALIHKERRPTQITERQNASMMLVGDVAERTAILIDDLADTCNTITRAAKLLKKEHATRVVALVTHGIFSGDAIERLKASALDLVVTTNSVDQREHKALLGDQLHVLEVGHVFAEAIRRVHHGESISVLFNYD